MKFNLILFLLTSSFICSTAFADSSLKLAYVDIQKALEQTKSGQKVQKEFKSEVDNEQKNIDRKKAEYESLKESLEKQRGSLNETTLREKEESLLTLERELKRSFQDSQEKLRRKNANLVGELVKKMRELIETIGKDQGYSMIIEKNSQAMIFADPSLDITDLVVKKFDDQ